MRALGQVRVAIKIALAVTAAGAVAAAAPAVAAGRNYPAGATRPAGLTAGHKPPPTSLLKAVAAAARTDAWAVGEFFTGTTTQTLIEHWNGRHWLRVASPNPAGSPLAELLGVASPSLTSAWAVGAFDNGTTLQTLIEHWNGRHWRLVASPNPAGASHAELFSVAADSPSSAWAVGNSLTGTTIRTLIEHWNGRHWRLVASPNPTGSPQAELFSVAAASRTSAWAVGDFVNGTTTQTLIEHWNGRHWRLVASPNPVGSPLVQLLGTAVSRTSAWAVGSSGDGTKSRTLIEHWNGRHWRLVASPNSASSARDSLSGVTATSPSSAWAVGKFFNGTTFQTLIEQWNGRRWRLVASPDPAGSSQPNELFGVAAASSSSAWAVGDFFKGTGLGTLIEHWNGAMWRHVLSPSP